MCALVSPVLIWLYLMCHLYSFSGAIELGLQRVYSEDDAVYIKCIRKLMALLFLPHCHKLKQPETEPLQTLVTYIRWQWIESIVFLPRYWSVYQLPVQATSVLLEPAPGQRGQTCSCHHQACVRKKTEAGPAKAVSRYKVCLTGMPRGILNEGLEVIPI